MQAAGLAAFGKVGDQYLQLLTPPMFAARQSHGS